MTKPPGGQHRGDITVYVDGSRLIVDVAVADTTAPSYRRPPPRHPSPPLQTSPSPAKNRPPRRPRETPVTTTLEGNTTSPAPASQVNRLQSSIESVRRR